MLSDSENTDYSRFFRGLEKELRSVRMRDLKIFIFIVGLAESELDPVRSVRLLPHVNYNLLTDSKQT